MNEPPAPKAPRRLDQTNEVQAGVVSALGDTVECPLCAGRGRLGRIEFLEKTGMREPSLIADLSATQAVERMHAKLWGDFRDQLTKQVAAETENLNEVILSLKGDNESLKKDLLRLKEQRDAEVAQARKTQEQADTDTLQRERQSLQDEIAILKGQFAKAKADLDAASKQHGLDVRAAADQVKQELTLRIDQLNEAVLRERTAKAELQTKLERTQSEVKQRELEAKSAAYDEKQKELDHKQQQIDVMKDELADLRAKVNAFPSKELVAVQTAINEQEGKLRKLELDRDTLQKERDGLKDELADARQKLEQRKGKVEERTFEELVAQVPGVWIEDWRSKKESGDYHVGLYDNDGAKLLPSKIVVDNKDVGRLTPKEVDKLVRDAGKHNVALAAMVVSDESALRPEDLDARFGLVGGVTLLRTTRDWFLRDLDLLKPLMRRQAEEGPDFMKRNVAVASEVRSHLKMLDQIETFMRLARENAEKAEKELKKYRMVMDDVCRGSGTTAFDRAAVVE